MYIHPIRLGVAGGILFGLTIFIMTVLSLYTGYADRVLNLLSDIYPGYEVSWVGSIIGFLYGFADAFIGLSILGWLYNKLPIQDKRKY